MGQEASSNVYRDTREDAGHESEGCLQGAELLDILEEQAAIPLNHIEHAPGEHHCDTDGCERRVLPQRIGDESRLVESLSPTDPEDESWHKGQ